MKYRQQLVFIIGFLGLRILTIVLYTFFRPAQPGPYTPYISFLYAIFDVLIIFFLYRYVKEIKQQRFSLPAVLVIVLMTTSKLIVEFYVFPSGATGPMIQPSYTNVVSFLFLEIVHAAMEFILALQLLKNKAAQPIGKALKLVGWSFLAVLGFDLLSPVFDIILYTDTLHLYFFQLVHGLPLIAMLFLYGQEWTTFNTARNYFE